MVQELSLDFHCGRIFRHIGLPVYCPITQSPQEGRAVEIFEVVAPGWQVLVVLLWFEIVGQLSADLPMVHISSPPGVYAN